MQNVAPKLRRNLLNAKKTNRDCIMRKRQTETSDQAAKRKNTNRDCIMRKQQTEMSDQAAKRKNTNRDCIMRK